MSYLKSPDQVWTAVPTIEDLRAGARYAAITLPWTFDRMMKGSTSKSLQRRALNIAKGVVVQKTLLREFERRGIEAPEQEKSYRDNDLFDFRLIIDNQEVNLDVKSVNHYSNYANDGREKFSLDLLFENAGYPGPDWRRFFPMMIPHTQINQEKEAYCFAIASSIDFRNDPFTDRAGYALTAFPFDSTPSDGTTAFYTYKKLCRAREEKEKGVFICCELIASELPLFNAQTVTLKKTLRLKVLGEWNGKEVHREIELNFGEDPAAVGPFSCVTSFQLSQDNLSILGEQNRIRISTDCNDLDESVRNSQRKNINIEPTSDLLLKSSDFCNLILPSEYTIHFIGWIPKEEFLEKCRKYPAWVWPNDRVSKYENQSWSQITEKDLQHLERSGFSDCIQDKPRRLNAGWLKTSGKPGMGNACCYVFPNIGRGGGVNETNLYVLPQDLHPMEELG